MDDLHHPFVLVLNIRKIWCYQPNYVHFFFHDLDQVRRIGFRDLFCEVLIINLQKSIDKLLVFEIFSIESPEEKSSEVCDLKQIKIDKNWCFFEIDVLPQFLEIFSQKLSCKLPIIQDTLVFRLIIFLNLNEMISRIIKWKAFFYEPERHVLCKRIIFFWFLFLISLLILQWSIRDVFEIQLKCFCFIIWQSNF